jgi:hypothetical protein
MLIAVLLLAVQFPIEVDSVDIDTVGVVEVTTPTIILIDKLSIEDVQQEVDIGYVILIDVNDNYSWYNGTSRYEVTDVMLADENRLKGEVATYSRFS